jgi:2-haloalkanoic acid dehalogenase type II
MTGGANRFALVTIDLDDTLWPSAPTLLQAEEALYRWLQHRAPRLAERHDQLSLREHRHRLMRERPGIAHDITEVRLASLRGLLLTHGYDAELADAAMRVFLDHRNRVDPYPEVAGVLRELSRRHRLVSLTNGNADPQRTPLRGLFHHSLNPAMVGAAKPDPAMFRAALDWAGVTAEQALHIGDDPWLDVVAARTAGLTAVWINRAGRSWPAELEPPAAQFGDLAQLPSWMAGAVDAL